MKMEEYGLLRASARRDGLLVAAMWVACFACYLLGLSVPMLSMVALLLVLFTPVAVARRLGVFRETVGGGSLSFGNGWLLSVLIFLHAALLFALAQYIYFAWMDQGFLVAKIDQMLQEAGTAQALSQYQMTEMVQATVEQLASMRPIDLAFNMLATNVLAGLFLSFPIALVMQRKR